MHHAPERISGEPRRRSAGLNALDSIPTPVLISHNNVPSRTNDSLAFTRFASCNTLLPSILTREAWARLTGGLRIDE